MTGDIMEGDKSLSLFSEQMKREGIAVTVQSWIEHYGHLLAQSPFFLRFREKAFL